MSSFLRPKGLYSQWNSPGQNTGVDSLSLLQGTFPTQESNRGVLHCRRILYQLSSQGSPVGTKVMSPPMGVGQWEPLWLLSWQVVSLCKPWTVVLCPCGSPDKNSGVGCHFLLQGIFLTRNRTQEPLCQTYITFAKVMHHLWMLDSKNLCNICLIGKDRSKEKFEQLVFRNFPFSLWRGPFPFPWILIEK